MPARHIYGDGKAVRVKTTASTMTNVGDLLGLVTGASQPAQLFPWTTDLVTTQAAFHGAFVGGAADASAINVDSDILAYTAGIHQYPCAALGSAANIGTFVGPAKAAGNNLDAQTVAVVADAAHAIGRTVEHAVVGQTYLKFEMVGTVTFGGPQVP